MYKSFKISVFLIILALGILFLGGTTVNATTTEVNSIDDLKALFDSSKITVSYNTITITESTSLDVDINIKSGIYIVQFTGDEPILELSGSIKTENGNIIFNGQNQEVWHHIIVPKGKSLKIEGGAYYGDFQNLGTLEVNGGMIDMGIGNYGKLTITDGQVVSQNSGGALWNMCDPNDTTCKGDLTITGGQIGGLSVDTGSSTKISGGKIESFFIYENATVELTGGEFISNYDDMSNLEIFLPEGQEYSESDIKKYVSSGYEARYEEYTDKNHTSGYKNVKIASLYEWNLIKKIAPDGKNAILKTVIPKDAVEADFILSNVVNKMLNEEDYFAYAYPIDMNDMTVCNVSIQGETFNNDYEIKITYEEPVENKEVQSFINKIKDFNDQDIDSYYQVKDLGLINYYTTSAKSELWNRGASARALKYSDEIIKLTDGGDIKYYLDVRAGCEDESLMFEYAFGEMTVFYNDYAYSNHQQGIFLKRVIYIPENTADSKEAYVEAAQKRINDYLGKDNLVTVEYGGNLNSLEAECLDESIPLSTTDGNYYNITVKGKTYKFYIFKGTAEQLEVPVYKGTDYETNVKITSTDSNIPLDTSINAVVVTSEQIEKALGTKNYKAYDITLYSDAKGANITKLENGKFIVSIPVPEFLKDKEVTVYYITSAGEKEEHRATVKDEIASFETDHFSTYILAETENQKDDTPKTGNIINIEVISILGIVALISINILKKKK